MEGLLTRGLGELDRVMRKPHGIGNSRTMFEVDLHVRRAKLTGTPREK